MHAVDLLLIFGAFYCKKERMQRIRESSFNVLLEDVRRSQDYYSSQGFGRTVKYSTCTKVRGGGGKRRREGGRGGNVHSLASLLLGRESLSLLVHLLILTDGGGTLMSALLIKHGLKTSHKK